MSDHPAYTRACAVPGSDLPHAKPYDAGERGFRCACGRNAAHASGWCGECAPGARCGHGVGISGSEGCPRVAGHLGERLAHPCEPPANPAAYPRRCCGTPWNAAHDFGCVFYRRPAREPYGDLW